MTGSLDGRDEMRVLSLDPGTAERLIEGWIAPDDAPPGYPEVAWLVRALRGGGLIPSPATERQAVAAMAEAIRSQLVTDPSSPRRFTVRNALRAKIVGTAFVGVLVGTTGLALAGALPGAAQGIASSMLAKIGISVPGPNAHAGTHPNIRGGSGEGPGASQASPPTDTKGSVVSQLARTTAASGVAKGTAISTLASGGKGQAGQHGQSNASTPNGGGTGTANTASGGASSAGSGTADTASGGHSGAGSGNGGGH